MRCFSDVFSIFPMSGNGVTMAAVTVLGKHLLETFDWSDESATSEEPLPFVGSGTSVNLNFRMNSRGKSVSDSLPNSELNLHDSFESQLQFDSIGFVVISSIRIIRSANLFGRVGCMATEGLRTLFDWQNADKLLCDHKTFDDSPLRLPLLPTRLWLLNSLKVSGTRASNKLISSLFKSYHSASLSASVSPLANDSSSTFSGSWKCRNDGNASHDGSLLFRLKIFHVFLWLRCVSRSNPFVGNTFGAFA